MTIEQTFRMRLRARVLRKLNIQAHDYHVQVAGHEFRLSASLPETNISDSEWIVFNSRGFASEPEARLFGHKVRAALELSSVATRLGVDAGKDLATTSLSQTVRDAVIAATGSDLRDNVHGVDVFRDDPGVRFLTISAQGSVLANPEPLLGDLDRLYAIADNASSRTRDAILLLNTALMQPNAVAQIVFALSAVEMLGQDEKWSHDQRQLLEHLAVVAEAAPLGTIDERNEVAEAIRKCHRLSLRQGVRRLLDGLGLSELQGAWDDIYGERSSLVHGLAPAPGAQYDDLASRTINLCGRILLTVIAVDIPQADRNIDQFYPEPTG